jgi:Protein of unknown function (DUF3574)
MDRVIARASSSLLLVLVLTACASMAPPTEEPVIADRLFCGLSIPGGGMVTDEEWTTFVSEVVTPRFPDGFTVWRADGQWRGPDGVTVSEPAMVIEIVHRISLDDDRAVMEIADEYRRRFRQQAVLRVSSPARMTFID